MDQLYSRDVLGLILREPLLRRRDIAAASQVCRLWRDVTAALREVHRRDHLWWNRPPVERRVAIVIEGDSEIRKWIRLAEAARRTNDQVPSGGPGRWPQQNMCERVIELINMESEQIAGFRDRRRYIHLQMWVIPVFYGKHAVLTGIDVERVGVQYSEPWSEAFVEDVKRIMNANLHLLDLPPSNYHAAVCPDVCIVEMYRSYKKMLAHKLVLTEHGFVEYNCGNGPEWGNGDGNAHGPSVPRVYGRVEMTMFPNVPLMLVKDIQRDTLILFRGEVRALIIRKTREEINRIVAHKNRGERLPKYCSIDNCISVGDCDRSADLLRDYPQLQGMGPHHYRITVPWRGRKKTILIPASEIDAKIWHLHSEMPDILRYTMNFSAMKRELFLSVCTARRTVLLVGPRA